MAEHLYCSICGEARGDERYTCRQGGESVPKEFSPDPPSGQDPLEVDWRDLCDRLVNPENPYNLTWWPETVREARAALGLVEEADRG